MGLMLAEPGFHTRCYVEWEEYPRSVIIAAQRAGYFAPSPIWDDLTTFDGRPFRGAIDTILAGYPCQPFSQAGQRRGEDDERHLWPEVARVIREIGPTWVFLENVAGHVTLGLETVLRELWDMGWTPAVGLFSAAETGAPHERLRVFIVAYRNGSERIADGGKSDTGADRRNNVGRSGGAVMADASSGRHGGSRQWEDKQPRRAETVWSGASVADSNHKGLQGKFASLSDPQGWEKPYGHARLRGGAGIFPPGPGDGAAWSAVIAMAPSLAPSLAFGDIARRAQDLVALAEAGQLAQAAAESELRRMVDGLASRSRALRLLGNGVFSLAAGHAWRTLAAAHGLGALDLEAADQGGSPNADDVPVRAAE